MKSDAVIKAKLTGHHREDLLYPVGYIAYKPTKLNPWKMDKKIWIPFDGSVIDKKKYASLHNLWQVFYGHDRLELGHA